MYREIIPFFILPPFPSKSRPLAAKGISLVFLDLEMSFKWVFKLSPYALQHTFYSIFYWPSGYGVIWISKWVVRNFQHKKAPKFRYLAVRFKQLAVSLVDLFEHVFNSNVGVNMDSESYEHEEKAANCEIFCKMSFHALYWTGSNLKPSHTNLTARFAAKTTFFQQAIKGVE